MRWFARFMTSAAAVLLTAGGASASEISVDAAWDTAVRSDSLEAYAAFVMMYPESKHARSAYDRLSGTADAAKTPGRTRLFADEQNDESSPAILPGMIMII